VAVAGAQLVRLLQALLVVVVVVVAITTALAKR
jgi:hypothetical protein